MFVFESKYFKERKKSQKCCDSCKNSYATFKQNVAGIKYCANLKIKALQEVKITN